MISREIRIYPETGYMDPQSAGTSAEQKAHNRALLEAFSRAEVGELVTVELEGTQIQARKIDFETYYQSRKNDAAEVMVKKIVPTTVEIAPGPRPVVTPRDAMLAYAEKGDLILNNPGEAAYIFGGSSGTVLDREAKFHRTYELIPGTKNQYLKKDPFPCVKVTEHVVFSVPWDPQSVMVAEKGSYLVKAGYSIDKDSFADGYEVVEPDEPATLIAI